MSLHMACLGDQELPLYTPSIQSAPLHTHLIYEKKIFFWLGTFFKKNRALKNIFHFFFLTWQ